MLGIVENDTCSENACPARNASRHTNRGAGETLHSVQCGFTRPKTSGLRRRLHCACRGNLIRTKNTSSAYMVRSPRMNKFQASRNGFQKVPLKARLSLRSDLIHVLNTMPHDIYPVLMGNISCRSIILNKSLIQTNKIAIKLQCPSHEKHPPRNALFEQNCNRQQCSSSLHSINFEDCPAKKCLPASKLAALSESRHLEQLPIL